GTPPAFVLSQDQTLQKVFDLLICFYSVYSLKFKRWRFVLFSFQRAMLVVSLRSDFINIPHFTVEVNTLFSFG
ncbi:hypothetical protein ACIQD3_17380, partial [Peribacillus loiseleuriae]|uniref:hypothetical protein n=1 Tax=Peribacillus loiseleuriae TaxID=1679170 RepID=UPI0038181734